MKQITFTIYAKDISTSIYLNERDCAITRGLRKAGYSELHDRGIGIYNDSVEVISNEAYQQMRTRVIAMYARIEEPQDFTVTLNYNQK